MADPSTSLFGEGFKFTLAELKDISVFVVERTWYDAAILRNWTCRDECKVLWRDPSGKGGKLWKGWIVSSKNKSNEFPGSPWERYEVQHESDPTNYYPHNPWELHDLENPWEHHNIDHETRDKLLVAFDHLQQSVGRKQVTLITFPLSNFLCLLSNEKLIVSSSENLRLELSLL